MDATRFLRFVRQTAPPVGNDPVDTELLRRYATERDEAAFAELIRRNGPLVLRTCQHVLGEASAEDAFQATFLLLVRSAGRLTRPGSLAGWLHAAAVRIARRARRGENRRREREAALHTPRLAPDDLTWREVREVLDRELAALPEKYRVPLVLCYLQELSYEQAARQVGCPVGALRGRLERGKERLRKRLARCGLPLAAPALVLGPPAQVSAALAAATLVTVRAGASGGPVPVAISGLLGPRTGLRVALLAPLVVALAAVGAVLAVGDFPADDKPKGDPPKAANPVAEAAPQPAVDRLGDPLPPGAVARLGTRRLFGPDDPRWTAFSPDGTKVASQNYREVTVCDAATGRPLVERTDYYSVGGAIGWRADGTGVAVVQLNNWSFFVSTFTDPNEKLPNLPQVQARPDGREFLALSPDARALAIVRSPDAKEFTIDLLPATTGTLVAGLKPVKTLGPFAGPCREIRYTTRGVQFLTDSQKQGGDWTISLVDHDKNAIARATTIPAPAYCVYGFMYSLSADGRLAAIPLRPKVSKRGGAPTNQHTGTIRVWNLDTGKELHSIPFAEGAYGTGHAFTPDGKKLITAGEKPYFHIWDVASGKEVVRAPDRFGVDALCEASSVAISPDGKRFATGRRDGRIDVWDTATAEPLIPLDTHRDALTSVAVSPDGRLAATLGADELMRVWELTGGKPVCTVPAPHPTANPYYAKPKRRLAFTPDGRGLVFTSGKELAQVDPHTGKLINLPGKLRGAKGVPSEFSADGRTLVTFAQDTVTLWDWPAGTVRLTVTVPLAPGKPEGKDPEVVRIDYAVRLSPDGQFLFTNSVRQLKDTGGGGSQNSNDVWDARTGKLLHRLEKPEASYPPAGFSPDSRVMYLGGHSNDLPKDGRTRADSLTAWDPVSGKILRRFVEPDQTGQPRHRREMGRWIQALAVSPDGRLLAAAEGILSFDGVWVYEAASGRPLKKLTGHERDVTDLTFSPDGRRLVSVSKDQTGLVWDMTLPVLTARRSGKPTEKELADAWERLSGADPGPAYLGIAALVAAPAEAVPLLKAKLRPAPVPTNADFDRLAVKLGADEAADREDASAELERYGPNAMAWAKARLAVTDSPEVRDRLRRFLARYDGPNLSPYELRCVRGIAALEAMGTPEARELLRELAKVKADTLTREALAALERLGNR